MGPQRRYGAVLRSLPLFPGPLLLDCSAPGTEQEGWRGGALVTASRAGSARWPPPVDREVERQAARHGHGGARPVVAVAPAASCCRPLPRLGVAPRSRSRQMAAQRIGKREAAIAHWPCLQAAPVLSMQKASCRNHQVRLSGVAIFPLLGSRPPPRRARSAPAAPRPRRGIRYAPVPLVRSFCQGDAGSLRPSSQHSPSFLVVHRSRGAAPAGRARRRLQSSSRAADGQRMRCFRAICGRGAAAGIGRPVRSGKAGTWPSRQLAKRQAGTQPRKLGDAAARTGPAPVQAWACSAAINDPSRAAKPSRLRPGRC